MSGPEPPSPAPTSIQEARPLREALRIAWPATLSLLLHSGYRVNDQYWIQDLGPSAQAALGLATFMLILNFAFVMVVHGGILSRTARAFGARNRGALLETYRAGIGFGMLWLAALAVAGWATTGFWVEALGARGETARMAGEYLERIYICLPFIALKPLTDAVFIGRGNTLTPMFLSGISVGLNFVLNPILIYGLGPIPALGVAGAAWATGISRGIGGLLGVIFLKRVYGLSPLGKRPSFAEARRIAAIGAPMGLSIAAYSLVFIAVLKSTVSPFGRDTQAGFGVAFNGVESISYCGLMGPAVAASSMVGRRLGAGDPAGARRAAKTCVGLSLGIALLFTLAFLFAPRILAGFYSEDPRVVEQGALYLWIMGWSQWATAAHSVLEQSLVGAGRTLGMSLLTAGGNGIRIPLCWLMAHPLGWGPAGAWWAMNASNYLKLAAIFLLFRQGRWHAGPPHPTPDTRPPRT